MKKLDFDSVRKDGLLLYEYIRGSVAQGCDVETSDEDHGGVYMAPIEQLVGLGFDYQDQIESTSHDDVWYELNKYIRLLLKSNPTMLESLFIDDQFVLYEHPIMTELKKHRDKFVTKQCFKPMFQFAKSQIYKMRGLNKKIVNPVTERLKPLDFAYTFRKQGSTKIEHWLEHRGLKQKYCGLVNIPNMDGMYGVFYDWGNHFQNEKITLDMLLAAKRNTSESETIDLIHQLKHDETLSASKKKELEKRIEFVQLGNMARFISSFYNLGYDPYNESFAFWFENQKPIGYKGMVGEDGESNELRLSSVAEGVLPICQMHYSKDKYSSHCRAYREYKDWENNRNPVRYESNLNKNYDSKNASHCMRLINMCIEIAKGHGFNVNRTNIDRELLLDIRNHKFEYDDLIKLIEEKEKEAEIAIANSTIPDSIDVDFINNLLLDIRKKQIK